MNTDEVCHLPESSLVTALFASRWDDASTLWFTVTQILSLSATHTHSLTATVVCYYPTNVLRVVHALMRGLDDIPVAGKRWMSNERWKRIRATNGFLRKSAQRFSSEMCVCGWVICVNHVYRCVPVPVQQQEQEVLSHERRDVPQSQSLPACKYLCRSHTKKRCLWIWSKNEQAIPTAAF